MYSFIEKSYCEKKWERRNLDMRGKNIICGARNEKFKAVCKARKSSWYRRAGIKGYSLENVKWHL